MQAASALRCTGACDGLEDAGLSPGKVTLGEAGVFLRHRFPNATEVNAVGHGEWSAAFTFRAAGRDLVVRFGTHLDDFERDRWAAQFSSPSLPVPVVLEIGSALGQHFCISERAFGRYLDDLDGAELVRALPGLFQSLEAMRAIHLPPGQFGILDGNGQSGFSDWPSFLLDVGEPSERLPGWRERLAQHPEALATFDAGLEELARVARADVTPNLVHSDLLNFNLLIGDDRPSAFLDWGSALAGDHLYDVAWLHFCQFWYPAWEGIDIVARARDFYSRSGVPLLNFEARFRACLIHIGLGSIQYTAFVQREVQLEEAARRTREMLEWSG